MNTSVGRLASCCLLLAAPWLAFAHSAPSLTPIAPISVSGNKLFDAQKREFLLQGALLSDPKAMTQTTFRVMRQRWNFNTVRIPISPVAWLQNSVEYLAQTAKTVQTANAEGLVVVLVATEDETGLPTTDLGDFWAAWAASFKDNGLVIFDLYSRPSPAVIPGGRNWAFWRNGGVSTSGRTLLGMQQLVDRIRAAGAKQLIAAPAFHDALDFQGYGPENYLTDSNILYEVHPYFDHALTDAQRDANFGFLATKFPLYAGEWGLPLAEDSASCPAIPADPAKAGDAVSQLLVYMLFKPMSWTVTGADAFGPDNHTPATLTKPWTCGEPTTQGLGAMLILWTSGDPFGFGSLTADQLGNIAGGASEAVAPGEILVIYGQAVGPEVAAPGQVDENGKLATALAGIEVRFDGIPAPIYVGDYYQITVQVPYEVSGKTAVKIQAINRGIPSNEITVPVAAALPGLFNTTSSLIEALAANEDGTLNARTAAAPAGSVVTLYASGLGLLTPAAETGRAATVLAQPTLPVSLTMSGEPAEILFAGAAPGTVGVIQINVRVPATLPAGTTSAPLVLTVGSRKTTNSIRLWVR